MNRIFSYFTLGAIIVLSTALGNHAKAENEASYFEANHGFNLGLNEMVDLSEIEGFERVRSTADLARFASKVPGAVGFTAHPLFESGQHRLASAVLWYSHLSPSNMSWRLYLFDEKEAKKQPGEAATEEALAAAEAQISDKLKTAKELIDGSGRRGVILHGDQKEKNIVARAVLQLSGTFQHTGEFGSNCAGCRSVVLGGTPARCGLGIQGKDHMNCCGSITKDGFCRYWELLLAREKAEQIRVRQ